MSYITSIDLRRVRIADEQTGLVFGLTMFRHPMTEKSVTIINKDGTTREQPIPFNPFDLEAAHIFKIGGSKFTRSRRWASRCRSTRRTAGAHSSVEVRSAKCKGQSVKWVTMHNRVVRAIAVSMMLAGVSRAQAPAPVPTGVATVGFMHAIHATNVLEKTLAFYTEVFGLSGQIRPFANDAVPFSPTRQASA